MSVDTHDGRRSTRGYEHSSYHSVDIFVARPLGNFTAWAEIDVNRSIFGRRLIVDFEPQPHRHGPT